jgi:hypothetical protein
VRLSDATVVLDATDAGLIPYEHEGPGCAHMRAGGAPGRANKLVDNPEHLATPEVPSLSRLDLAVLAWINPLGKKPAKLSYTVAAGSHRYGFPHGARSKEPKERAGFARHVLCETTHEPSYMAPRGLLRHRYKRYPTHSVH